MREPEDEKGRKMKEKTEQNKLKYRALLEQAEDALVNRL